MNFLDEMGLDWEFDNSHSAEYEQMKAELERDRQVEFYNSPSAEQMRAGLERDRIAIFDFQMETMRAVGMPIQNLHPKKTEKVNWQKEGF